MTARPVAPKKRSKTESRRFAYHEAGHAVVTDALGRVVREVSIEGDGAPPASFTSETELYDYESEAVALVAGHIAERVSSGKKVALHLFCSPKAFEAKSRDVWAAVELAFSAVGNPDKVTRILDHHSRYDYRAVRGAYCVVYAYERGERPLHAFLARALERSEEILRERWPAVEALAAALLEHDELDGEQARAIIAAALKEKAA